MQQSFSLEEIRSLFMKKLVFDQLHAKKTTDKLRAALGRAPTEEDPDTVKFEKAFLEGMADVAASRLFEGDTSQRLLNLEDTDILTGKMVGSMVDELASKEDEEVSAAERATVKAVLSTMFCAMVRSTIQAVEEMTEATNENPHESFWKWVRIVNSNASDRHLSLDEFLACEDAFTVIMRQLYSREQYEQRSAYALAKYDGSKFISAIMEPGLQLVDDPQEREEKRTALLEEARADIQTVHDFLQTHSKEEILRIYGER